MSKRDRTITRLVLVLLAGGLLVGVAMFRGAIPAIAHVVPSPCDFTTGGGFVMTDQMNHANFGLVGGCKPNRFFGHVNFVDHDTTGTFAGLHVSSDSITAYVDPCINGCPSQYRDICGTADTNLFGPVIFRVRTLDKAEPGVGADRFGIELVTSDRTRQGVVVSTRALAGGNIQLHKPAPPGTTGPSLTEDQITAACGGQTGADLGQ